MGVLNKLIVTGALLGGLAVYLCPCLLKSPTVPTMPQSRWWGKGKEPIDASSRKIESRPFKVSVDESVIQDLKKRLENTRLSDPLENVNFNYGFNTDHLKFVLQYWQTKYDWRKQETALNQFPQFLAKIEGIDVHYIHVKPTGLSKSVRVLPLLMVHGWPGSIVEFYKIIPLLAKEQANTGIAFEVICPSIPGYGFSEAPHHPGFAGADAARVFSKLMTSLGHPKFYYQGGDWGALIGNTLAILYPERVHGLHLNFAPLKAGLFTTLKYIVGSYAPSLVFSGNHKFNIFPFKTFLSNVALESGYFHIQATKPDTAGVGLSDSPAGLAAYILEKFSSWTSLENRDKKDGGLLTKFTMDELLTNVMVYWVTNSITSSMRFYKENFNQEYNDLNFDGLTVHVPTGVGIGPNELIVSPREMLSCKYPQLVSYNHLPQGGHFAAFEEPKLVADDFVNFVVKVEELAKIEASKKTNPTPAKGKSQAKSEPKNTEKTETQGKKPEARGTKPVVADTKPVVKDTKPVVKDTKPVIKDTKPVVKDTKPVVKDSKPVVKDTKPEESAKKTQQETGKKETSKPEKVTESKTTEDKRPNEKSQEQPASGKKQEL